MRFKLFSPTIACLVLFSCSAEKTDDSTSKTSLFNTPEGADVEEKLKQYYDDMSNRDWEKYRSHFWDNATITTAWQQPGDSVAIVDVTTIDDFIKETPIGPDSQPVFEEKMKNSKIHVEGNIAEAWVEYEAKFGKRDSLMEWSGTDVFTLLRHDGQWKIVSLVFESK
jgi:hypothetical protein